MPGLSNELRLPLSSTGRSDPLHGIPCRAMTLAEIKETIRAFADGAWRAREAGLDGVEVHAADGCLIHQFLSSAVNDRRDEYGGGLENRARFLLDIIDAIRHKVEARGADALHVSIGSMFPHPLNPPGDFAFDTAVRNYDAMLSSGLRTFRNYLVFRYRPLRPLFSWIWDRMKRGRPIEGVSAEAARATKAAVSIPVISTGGYQTASFIRGLLQEGYFDAVSIARALLANPGLPRDWGAGQDLPDRPCTYCNKCLLNVIKHPLGCYELIRFSSYEAMVDEIHSVYPTPASAAFEHTRT
jgi:2,4-dienoyl-CoA reductase (NADPH2)